MKRIFSVAVLLVAACNLAFSQTEGKQAGKLSIGAFGAYNLSFHNASFLDIPTAPVFAPRTGAPYEPTAFGNTSSGGAAFGALVMYNFTEELALSLRLGYGSHDAAFRTTSTYPVGRTDGTTADATSEYTINASIGALSIEPLVSYRIVAGLQAYLGVRLNVVTGNSFDQRETLLAPTDGGFDQNRNRSRNIRTGAIPQLQSLWFSGVAGLGYDIPLSDALVLSPEAFYSLGLNQIVQGINWNMNTLRGGISLRYRL
jgi:hypothetical protein